MKRSGAVALRWIAVPGRDQAWALPLVLAMLLAALAVFVLVRNSEPERLGDSVTASEHRIAENAAGSRSSSDLLGVRTLVAATTARLDTVAGVELPRSVATADAARSGAPARSDRPSAPSSPTKGVIAPASPITGGGTGTTTAPAPSGTTPAPQPAPDPGPSGTPGGGAGSSGGKPGNPTPGTPVATPPARPTPPTPVVTLPPSGGAEVNVPVGGGNVGVGVTPGNGVQVGVTTPSSTVVGVSVNGNGIGLNVLGLHVLGSGG